MTDSVELKSDTPKVSVIMAVYNVAPFLREAVDSVLAQSFTDFELIVINDGSTDEGGEILDGYDDPRLRVIHQENCGLFATRNRLILESRAEYVAVFDGDDINLPNRLALQAEFLDQHPEFAIVGGQEIEISEEGKQLSEGVRFPTDPEVVAEKMLYARCTIIWDGASMFRRSVALDLGLYPIAFEDMSADEEFFSRMMLYHRGTNLSEPVAHRRIRRGSVSSLYPAISRRNFRFIRKQHRRIRESKKSIHADREFAELVRRNQRDIQRIKQATSIEKQLESNYMARLGRAALRGKHWRLARQYYYRSIALRPWQWLAYTGVIRAYLKKGGISSRKFEDT